MPPLKCKKDVLYQVTLPYACFGVIVVDWVITEAAPIGKWMLGKNINYISVWVTGKSGKIEKISK